jgi:hypothetical protein
MAPFSALCINKSLPETRRMRPGPHAARMISRLQPQIASEYLQIDNTLKLKIKYEIYEYKRQFTLCAGESSRRT